MNKGNFNAQGLFDGGGVIPFDRITEFYWQ
jgi:hypothetical protein